MKITKEIIAAMKTSDSFVVRIIFNGNEHDERYTGTLTCIEKERRNSKGWIKPEKPMFLI